VAHFTLPIGPAGPVLSAFVAVSQARHAALTAAGQPVPSPVPIRALVDTGASCTCVDASVLAALGLTPTGSTQMMTPSTGATPHEALQYDVALAIPAAPPNPQPFYKHTLPVVGSELSIQGIDALIGRDILKDCLLTYNGVVGFFTLAF